MRISDWSSDVCSSDLEPAFPGGQRRAEPCTGGGGDRTGAGPRLHARAVGTRLVAGAGAGHRPDPGGAADHAAGRERRRGPHPARRRASTANRCGAGCACGRWLIGIATCGERVFKYVEILEVTVTLKKEKSANFT